MCGIFGATSQAQSGRIVLDGLKRLEYRGYDSWGLAWLKPGGIGFLKKTGKISKNKRVPVVSSTIMGHTRWATHGKVTEQNCHPHFSQAKTVAVVHNGIVENFWELKKRLGKKGVVFESQTDTEVIPQLIARYLKKENPLKAIRKAVLELHGNLAFCAMVSGSENMYCFRRQAPLVIGRTASEKLFVSSDAGAFPKEVVENFFLGENEIACLGKSLSLFDARSGRPAKPVWKKAFSDSFQDKQGYRHFMLKEIFEQPSVIRAALQSPITIPVSELKKARSALILACGTSWHAGLVAGYWFEQLAGLPTRVEYASEYRYRNSPLSSNTLIIVISQSGETADTLAAINSVKKNNGKILALSNQAQSSIARQSDWVIDLCAGPEIGVASTKAFTAQLAILARLAIALARARGMKNTQAMQKELESIPSKVQQILRTQKRVSGLAKRMARFKNAIFLGRDKNYPIALEGALKLKEVSYIHAEGMPAAEMKHGPIALIDKNMPVIAIAVQDSLYPKMFSNLQEIKARQGYLIVITDRLTPGLKQVADEALLVPSTREEFSPMLTVVPLQLLAYETAVFKKLDVDKPRNLAKSVTVE